MGRNIIKKFLPLLIVGLVLASSFAIMGGVSGAEMPTASRAYGDGGKILYIYGNDKSLAQDWRVYLEDKDYKVDLLPQDGVMNAEFAMYDLIIIGNGSNSIGSAVLKDMYRSGVPILGIGNGGVYL